MTKKRIRYSELAQAPPPPAAPPTSPAAAIAEVPARRVSTPVDLARALAAARAAEEAALRSAEADALQVVPAQALPVISRKTQATSSPLVELLMFDVGGERFAVELELVEEVIDRPHIHFVPEMPPAMVGVVSVRNSFTPVYSPEQALGLALASRHAVLIFRRGRLRAGILIDDVHDAATFDLRTLRDTAPTDASAAPVLGVLRSGDALVTVIDAELLLQACARPTTLETA